MNRGIVIYAFGKPTYGKLAFNLAVSLKFNSPEIPICLIYEASALTHLSVDNLKYFDQRIEMKREHIYDGEKFSPGKAKLAGYEYFPFEQNMIIDADSVCIKPVEPLFDKCSKKPIYAQTVGTWLQDADQWTCQWMGLKDCKEVFKLPDEYRLFEINSSFMVVKKCQESQDFYAQAMKNYLNGAGHPKVSKIWGGTFPDELAFNMAFAQCGVEPQFDEVIYEQIDNVNPKPIYFSTKERYNAAKYGEDFYFLGCYGGRNFTSKSLQEQCDIYMRKYAAHFNYFHQWKYHLLMRNKHIEKK